MFVPRPGPEFRQWERLKYLEGEEDGEADSSELEEGFQENYCIII